MLVQSGRPVGVMRTHEWAPRVLIANSNLFPDWANWPEFRRLEKLGLTMYGQMTAGSWIYIGTQGIVQGTYETFAAIAEKRFNGTLAGTLTLTGGCGGMGGAQPLAVTLNDGACLIVDVDRTRLQRRVDHRYLDEIADDLDDAIDKAAARPRPTAGPGPSASSATPPRSSPSCSAAAWRSTSSPTRRARTTRCPTCRVGVELEDWHDYAEKKPEEFTDRARESMARHVQAMVEFQDGGAEVFDYGNSIRDEARHGGYDRAFDFPGFVPAYIRPLFCEGKGPFRWAALSGDPKDIYATDKAVMDLFPDNDRLQKWMRGAKEKIAFQGLPARICWLGYGERDKAGLALQRPGRLGRGVRARSSSAATTWTAARSPRPTARPSRWLDGSDAIADWPLLNAMVNTASGASWVSIHHGGGVGIGRSIHAGQVSLADGTDAGGGEARPGAHQRPGDGRHPARRRGLRHRRRRRRRARRADPDARGLSTGRGVSRVVRNGFGDVLDLGSQCTDHVVSVCRGRDSVGTGTDGDGSARDGRVGDHRPRGRRAERRDRPAHVAGDVAGGVLVGHRQPVDPEVRAQLGPGDLPVAGHEDEQEVTLAAPDDDRLDDVARLDAPGRGRLLERAHRTMPRQRVSYAARGQRPGRTARSIGHCSVGLFAHADDSLPGWAS